MTSDGERPRSADLEPSTRLYRQDPDNGVVTLERRKKESDFHRLPYRPGWWLVDDGGLADDVIDTPGSPRIIVSDESVGSDT